MRRRGYIGGLDIIGDLAAGTLTPQQIAQLQQAVLGVPPNLDAQLAYAGKMQDAQRAGSHAFHNRGGAELSWDPSNKPLQRQPLPLPAAGVLIAAASTVTIPLTPQRAFRVERLTLQSDTTPSTLIVTRVDVGAVPQFVAAGGIPISMFSNTAFDTYLRGGTAYPGITIFLDIRNPSAAAETVFGAFLGEAAEL